MNMFLKIALKRLKSGFERYQTVKDEDGDKP
jgi:hypothetical protein